jgi:ribonuclease HI
MNTELYFDGACEPVNPDGTAAYGYLLKRAGKVIAEGAGIVGEGAGMTNNIAEYTGFIEGLKKFKELGAEGHLAVRGDSNLVISMVSKKWGWNRKKTRWVPHDDMPHLKVLLDQALLLLEGLDYDLAWVPREKNGEADRLSKKPLIEKGIISAEMEVRLCPICGNSLVKRSGKFGVFYGCKNYPNCTYTERTDSVPKKK